MHYCDWPYLTESSAFLQLHPTSKSARILSDASFCYVAGCFTFLTIFFVFLSENGLPKPAILSFFSWCFCFNFMEHTEMHELNKRTFLKSDTVWTMRPVNKRSKLSANSGWLHEENDMHVSTNDMEYRRVCYFITVDDYLTTHSNKGK